MLKATQTLMQRGLRSLSEIFLQVDCAVCDRATPTVFCIDCQRQLEASYFAAEGWQLKAHNDIKFGALGAYQGTLKQAILTLKYQNRLDVASILGAALAKRWAKQVSTECSDPLVIPIPLHSNRLEQRGYNQAALIGRAFCQASGLPMLAHGLIRQQDTLPQHQLGLSSRQANLKTAFKVGKDLQKRQQKSRLQNGPRKRTAPHILLVDDIYTTGATAQSAAQTLIAKGFPVIGILALARAIND
ncbi:MAG: ComF family protein [Cyanobacteria bacterium J06560_2]